MSLLVGGNKCFVLALRPTSFAEETAFNVHHHLPSKGPSLFRDTTLLQTCETSNGQQDHSVSGWRDIQNLEIQTCPICGLRFSFREYLNETATSSFSKVILALCLGIFGMASLTINGICRPFHSMGSSSLLFFPKLRTYLNRLVHW